jgi:hypothetical protein
MVSVASRKAERFLVLQSYHAVKERIVSVLGDVIYEISRDSREGITAVVGFD